MRCRLCGLCLWCMELMAYSFSYYNYHNAYCAFFWTTITTISKRTTATTAAFSLHPSKLSISPQQRQQQQNQHIITAATARFMSKNSDNIRVLPLFMCNESIERAFKKPKITTTTTTTTTMETSCETAVSKSTSEDVHVDAPTACGNDNQVEMIPYLEFYSGVGGWTMALEQAWERIHSEKSNNGNSNNNSKKQLCCIAALDNSDLCTKVYQHNFGLGKRQITNKTFNIERLTLNQVQQEENDNGNDNYEIDSLMQNDANNKKKNKPKKLSSSSSYSWKANIWAMSPPCQPHTRQHSNQEQDLNDPRSASFLHLCTLLEQMEESSLPHVIFLENVIGFESSNTFQRWLHVLNLRNYHVGHFHLSPTQVGLPNDRPRHFSIAVLSSKLVVAGKKVEINTNDNNNNDNNIITNDETTNDNNNNNINNHMDESVISKYLSIPTIQQDGLVQIHTSFPEIGIVPPFDNNDKDAMDKLPTIETFLDDYLSTSSTSSDKLSTSTFSLQVPEKIIAKSASWCFDIVSPQSKRSACFTSSYGKFIKGTGSILYDDMRLRSNNHGNQNNDTPSTITTTTTIDNDTSTTNTKDSYNSRSSNNNDSSNNNATTTTINYSFDLVDPQEREFQKDWMTSLDISKLRYFSGMEMARLMGYSSTFSFPSDMPIKQQWKLIGNSLNVKLASRLVEFGLLAAGFADNSSSSSTTTTTTTATSTTASNKTTHEDDGDGNKNNN